MEYQHDCPVKTKMHLHEVQGSVRVNGREDHSHRLATVSCEPIEVGGSHVHQVTFRTDTYEGHYHEFTGRTDRAVRVGDGHVHFLDGSTTEAANHRHSFKLVTHIEDPTEDNGRGKD